MKYQKPRGTEDIYYENSRELSKLEFILKEIVELYNYSEIRTPIFECKELFIRSVGKETDIIEKEMFELSSNKINTKMNTLVLRPEGTSSIIRSIIENKLYSKYTMPLKLYYIGSMFRHERPQYGRLRQFNQFGVEVVGNSSFLLDVEVILLAYNILKIIGLKNINLKLNCLVTNNNNYQKYINDLQEFLINKSKLCIFCKNRLDKNPLKVLDCKIDNHKFNDINIPKIYNYLDKKESEYFNNVQRILKKFNIDFIIDHKLVRGLDYYTSLVFEITLSDQESRELVLIGGGKYDKLVSELEKKLDLKAIGFAMGLERILISLKKNNIRLSSINYLDAYIICVSKNENVNYFAMELLFMLRSFKYKVDFDYSNKNIKSKFKLVKKLNVRNVIIIGDKELKKNIVKVKNQYTGKERNIKLKKIINFLKKEKDKYEKNS